MRGFGTDVVALACILGGAAVGGAVTLGALRYDARVDGGHCVAESWMGPEVAISWSGPGEAVAVAEGVHLRDRHECATVVVDERVRVRMEGIGARMEEARLRMEEARLRVDEARTRVEEARLRLEETEGTELEALTEALTRLESRRAELERQSRRLERVADGSGR